MAPRLRRRRREGDEGAAVSVACCDELAGNVRAQQLDAGGVDTIGDRERAAQVAGRLGEAHVGLAFLARCRAEGDVSQVDLVRFDAKAVPREECAEVGDQSVEACRSVEDQRAATAVLTEGHLTSCRAAARDLQRPAIQVYIRGERARLDEFVPAADDAVTDRGSATGHDLDGAAEDQSGADRPAAADNDFAAAAITIGYAAVRGDRQPAARHDFDGAAGEQSADCYPAASDYLDAAVFYNSAASCAQHHFRPTAKDRGGERCAALDEGSAAGRGAAAIHPAGQDNQRSAAADGGAHHISAGGDDYLAAAEDDAAAGLSTHFHIAVVQSRRPTHDLQAAALDRGADRRGVNRTDGGARGGHNLHAAGTDRRPARKAAGADDFLATAEDRGADGEAAGAFPASAGKHFHAAAEDRRSAGHVTVQNERAAVADRCAGGDAIGLEKRAAAAHRCPGRRPTVILNNDVATAADHHADSAAAAGDFQGHTGVDGIAAQRRGAERAE